MKYLLSFLLVVSTAISQTQWTNVTPSGGSATLWGSAFANNRFLVVGEQGTFLYSLDGSSWSRSVIPTTVNLYGVTFGGGKYVVVGDQGVILYSTDLSNWLLAKAATTTKLNSVAWDVTGGFLAVGDAGVVLSSQDGLTWKVETSPSPGFLRGIITYTNQGRLSPQTGWAVSGQGGGIFFKPFTSPSWSSSGSDLKDWQAISQDALGNWVVVGNGFGNYRYFPPASNGAITQTSTTLRGLAQGNNVFVATGDAGAIYTSTDAKTWTLRYNSDSPGNAIATGLYTAAYGNNTFITAGVGGMILTSSSSSGRFINLSTRATAGNDANSCIVGFVIKGAAPKQVLIRAAGPALTAFNVPGVIQRPKLTVYESNSKPVATNTGWTNGNVVADLSSAFATVGAFSFVTGSSDCALLVTLPPGLYSAQVTPTDGNPGVCLTEVYELGN